MKNPSSSIEESRTPHQNPFAGFALPESNFFMMPRDWLNIRAKYARFPSMVFCVEYILAHTWGWTYRDEDGNIIHEQKIRLTRDDFVNGRKKKDGTRYDNGTGLSESSVANGLEMAEKEGFIEVEIDDSDKGRIKKSYSLKMKATKDAAPPAGESSKAKTSKQEKGGTKGQSESRGEAAATDTTRGLTVTPLTVDPLRSNRYPSYKRVNNPPKNFKPSIIESEKVVNGKRGEEPGSGEAPGQPKVPITNYASLSTEEKLQTLTEKSRNIGEQRTGAWGSWKEKLHELKRQVEVQTNHAPSEPLGPHIAPIPPGVGPNPSKPYDPPQIENKTPVRELEKEIKELEYLLDSLNVLAQDVGRKLGDTKHTDKNVRHMTNDYRDAAKKGKSFSDFMQEVYYVCKDVQARKNVKNRGAYFWKALEEKLGLREANYQMA